MKLRIFLHLWALIAVSISRFQLFSGCLKLPFLFFNTSSLPRRLTRINKQKEKPQNFHTTFWDFFECRDLNNLKVQKRYMAKNCLSSSTHHKDVLFCFQKSLKFTIIANISRLAGRGRGGIRRLTFLLAKKQCIMTWKSEWMAGYVVVESRTSLLVVEVIWFIFVLSALTSTFGHITHRKPDPVRSRKLRWVEQC